MNIGQLTVYVIDQFLIIYQVVVTGWFVTMFLTILLPTLQRISVALGGKPPVKEDGMAWFHRRFLLIYCEIETAVQSWRRSQESFEMSLKTAWHGYILAYAIVFETAAIVTVGALNWASYYLVGVPIDVVGWSQLIVAAAIIFTCAMSSYGDQWIDHQASPT